MRCFYMAKLWKKKRLHEDLPSLEAKQTAKSIAFPTAKGQTMPSRFHVHVLEMVVRGGITVVHDRLLLTKPSGARIRWNILYQKKI